MRTGCGQATCGKAAQKREPQEMNGPFRRRSGDLRMCSQLGVNCGLTNSQHDLQELASAVLLVDALPSSISTIQCQREHRIHMDVQSGNGHNCKRTDGLLERVHVCPRITGCAAPDNCASQQIHHVPEPCFILLFTITQ